MTDLFKILCHENCKYLNTHQEKNPSIFKMLLSKQELHRTECGEP